MKSLKITNLAKKHKPNTTWPQEARIQAVSQYLVLGNMALVSATTGIPHQLLRTWKMQPWWTEIEAQVRATENLQMDTKLTKIVDKSLDAVLDRVENGEFIYDKKLGKHIRKPANLRDVARVSVDILTKRELLRGNATERTEVQQVPVADQLKALALEFAKWQQPQKRKETIDVETIEVPDAIHDEREAGLQEGTELGKDDTSWTSEGPSGTQSSTSDDGEGWESTQGRWETSGP